MAGRPRGATCTNFFLNEIHFKTGVEGRIIPKRNNFFVLCVELILGNRCFNDTYVNENICCFAISMELRLIGTNLIVLPGTTRGVRQIM